MSRQPPGGETARLRGRAAAALEHVGRLLDAGFTGRITIYVNQGGVRRLEITESVEGRDLSQRAEG